MTLAYCCFTTIFSMIFQIQTEPLCLKKNPCSPTLTPTPHPEAHGQLFYNATPKLTSPAQEGELMVARKPTVMVSQSNFGPKVFPGTSAIKLFMVVINGRSQ